MVAMAKRSPITEYLERQFIAWQMETGGRRTVAEFADWLGVPRGTFNKWMNGTRSPGKDHITILAEKLGPGIYDVLGVPRPDQRLQRIIRNWGRLPPEARRELERMVDTFLQADVGGDIDAEVGAGDEGQG